MRHSKWNHINFLLKLKDKFVLIHVRLKNIFSEKNV